MKAVIFNSGLGNRMGEFTQKNHKSMARLKNGETIFHRQIRLLSAEGITDFIVTTGPFEDQLKSEAADFPHLNFSFVRNDIYNKTNYIYSMYLARDLKQTDSHPDEDEFLDVVKMSFDELLEQVMSGEITDAKTVATVLKTKLFLDREQN